MMYMDIKGSNISIQSSHVLPARSWPINANGYFSLTWTRLIFNHTYKSIFLVEYKKHRES